LGFGLWALRALKALSKIYFFILHLNGFDELKELQTISKTSKNFQKLPNASICQSFPSQITG
jgi:hypothetical protein